MIFTLTCNLLAERTLEFESWSPGRTQRAVAESFQVGGKGINVSKMLARLRTPATALCFAGGETGTACETWLSARPFAVHAFPSATPTRAGTVVRDRSGTQRETTFLGPDAPIDAAAISACAAFLDTQPAGHILALCGSVPGWLEPRFDPLRVAFERWLARGTLVIDTYGPPLAWATQRAVSLIKINADELRALSPDGGTLLPPAPQRWVVTDGPRPISVRDADRSADTLIAPRIQEISPTGSGDVLLAALLHAQVAHGLSLRDAVAFAIPYAAANAAHPGVADFPIPLAAP